MDADNKVIQVASVLGVALGIASFIIVARFLNERMGRFQALERARARATTGEGTFDRSSGLHLFPPVTTILRPPLFELCYVSSEASTSLHGGRESGLIEWRDLMPVSVKEIAESSEKEKSLRRMEVAVIIAMPSSKLKPPKCGDSLDYGLGLAKFCVDETYRQSFKPMIVKEFRNSKTTSRLRNLYITRHRGRSNDLPFNFASAIVESHRPVASLAVVEGANTTPGRRGLERRVNYTPGHTKPNPPPRPVNPPALVPLTPGHTKPAPRTRRRALERRVNYTPGHTKPDPPARPVNPPALVPLTPGHTKPASRPQRRSLGRRVNYTPGHTKPAPPARPVNPPALVPLTPGHTKPVPGTQKRSSERRVNYTPGHTKPAPPARPVNPPALVPLTPGHTKPTPGKRSIERHVNHTPDHTKVSPNEAAGIPYTPDHIKAVKRDPGVSDPASWTIVDGELD
ncbi:hypothetical protein ABKN59_005581 [Abortiporus biennis]